MLPPNARVAVALIVIAAGIFVTTLATITYRHGKALAADGVITEAALTGVGQRGSDSETGRQVRYRFRVGDRDYQRVGVFGTAVDSDVTAEEQARAVESGRLPVRYLPRDPSVNEPVSAVLSHAERSAIGVGIGAVMILAGLLRLVLARMAKQAGPT